MADRRRQLRAHAHGRPAARGLRASERRDRRRVRRERSAHGGRRSRASPFRASACFATSRNACERRVPISPSSVRRPRDMPTLVEEVAALGVDILLEKPFAASLADADRILAAVAKSGVRLAVNWPLRWYPLACHDQAADRRRGGRQGDRGSFLRRQSRAALSPRRQGRGVGRGGAPREAGFVVVQQGRRRRQPARLSRLRRDARDLVHERRGADRSDFGRRSAAGTRGRRALDHRLPLRRRTFQDRDALGRLHRSLDHPASAQMRLRHRRVGRHDLELRLRPACRRADPRATCDRQGSRR